MSTHDFTELFAQYPAVIEDMKEEFTSHEFILKLANKYQKLYIEALYSYRDHLHRDTPAPFMIVHRILSQHLNCYPTLIEQVSSSVPSEDIFSHENNCAKWRKLN